MELIHGGSAGVKQMAMFVGGSSAVKVGSTLKGDVPCGAVALTTPGNELLCWLGQRQLQPLVTCRDSDVLWL